MEQRFPTAAAAWEFAEQLRNMHRVCIYKYDGQAEWSVIYRPLENDN